MEESGAKQQRQWGRKHGGFRGSHFMSFTPHLVSGLSPDTEKGLSGEAREVGRYTFG